MITQHTPGPWYYEEANIRSETGFDVAHVDTERSTSSSQYDPVPEAEWIANTHLIAAAPDLLDALQNMHRFLARIEGFLQEHEMWDDEEQDLLEANERAIAKAEGENKDEI